MGTKIHGYYDTIKPRPTEAHAAVVNNPDSVTQFICPNRVDDKVGGNSGTHSIDAYGKCRYCKASRTALANRYRVV